MNDQLTPADVLERGADAIDKFGHAKGRFQDANGALCAAGAISVGEGCAPNASYREAGLIAYCLLKRAIGLDCVGAFWNDAPNRTKEEVTSTMRACAALWRAQSHPLPAAATESGILDSECSLQVGA